MGRDGAMGRSMASPEPVEARSPGTPAWAGFSAPPRALPHRQIHVIDPFVKWSAAGVLVQLELDADHIRPRGIVDVPGLVQSVTSET